MQGCHKKSRFQCEAQLSYHSILVRSPTHRVASSCKNLQALQLANLMKRFNMMAHVNLIPYNPVDGSDFVRPSRNRVARFSETLTKAGIANSIRITKGLDASAACGQLRNEHQKTPLPSFAGLA